MTTILIVEDNDLNMKFLHDLLELNGYEIEQAGSGHEAMARVREHRPDLILMDMQLPDMSGLDVTRLLKTDPGFRSIPVVAVTAYALKADEERIRAGGCDGYVAKPIAIDGFLQTVADLTGRSRPS
jgi:two-component system cell cycle response regulator DivK